MNYYHQVNIFHFRHCNFFWRKHILKTWVLGEFLLRQRFSTKLVLTLSDPIRLDTFLPTSASCESRSWEFFDLTCFVNIGIVLCIL